LLLKLLLVVKTETTYHAWTINIVAITISYLFFTILQK
jgi:hypothetical protein